jgi:hypothetical protein
MYRVVDQTTSDERAALMMTVGRVAFVDNPSGGLACCNTDTGEIYLNGEGLDGTPSPITPGMLHHEYGQTVNVGRLMPATVAAYWHEVGHLITPTEVLRASIDHPSSETARVVLNEVVADELGKRIMRSTATECTWDVERIGLLPVTPANPDAPDSAMLELLAHVTSLESINAEAVDDKVYVLTYATQHEYRTGEECPKAIGILGEETYRRVQKIRERVVSALCTSHAVENNSRGAMISAMEEWCAILDEIAPPSSNDMADLKRLVARAVVDQMGSTREQRHDAESVVKQMLDDACSEETPWSHHKVGVIEKAPVGADWALRTQLREALVHLNYPDITRAEGWEAGPPGRLSGARAMQREALTQIDPFLGESVLPFRRVDRRVDPMIPLSVGVILDQSGSMSALADPVTSLGWALGGAVRDIDGKAAIAGMGSLGYMLDSTYTFRDDVVRSAHANGAIENFHQAWVELNRSIDLENAPGVKLLIVATDWEIVNGEQVAYAQYVLDEFRQSGGFVLSIGTYRDKPAIDSEFGHLIDAHTTLENAAQGVIDIYSAIRLRKERAA